MRNYNHKTVNSVKYKHQINKRIDINITAEKNEKKIIQSNTVRRVSAKINNVLYTCARTSLACCWGGPRVLSNSFFFFRIMSLECS